LGAFLRRVFFLKNSRLIWKDIDIALLSVFNVWFLQYFFVISLKTSQIFLKRLYMYAIVRTGGKQYQVACGDQVRVEKLEGNVGDSIDLVDVLMVSDGDDVKIGQPVLENAKVTAKIAEQGRGKKVIVFKKKRRKGYRLKKGHRQDYTALKIEEISA
jgi:large subunit ribosomal protein L21